VLKLDERFDRNIVIRAKIVAFRARSKRVLTVSVSISSDSNTKLISVLLLVKLLVYMK
jgi:hypothetical protein